MHKLEQTWRWYGSEDSVSLQDIKQAGATGIVSALHHIPHGAVWPKEDIKKRKDTIEQAGLSWSVVESLPVHEAIKTGQTKREELIENYKISLKNLAEQGIKTICYNFMPVLDWTRTEIEHELQNGAQALYFNWVDLALFDVFVLKRTQAEKDYKKEVITKAQKKFESLSEKEKDDLKNTILMGIPGEGNISLEALQKSISIYEKISPQELRENLIYFLKSIADTCSAYNIKMTLHPDDPPYPILGLPRIASTLEDYQFILNEVDNEFNGVCFCSGSLSAGDQSVPKMFDKLKKRVNFLHLRSVKKDEKGNFYEADHLDGDVDMVALMDFIVKENQLRKTPIPFRPDHGHKILDDIGKDTNPGYSAIGRLKGLAELRGIEKALTH